MAPHQQADTRLPDFFFRPVRQTSPFGDFSTQVERQAADAVIRISIGHHNGGLNGRIYFARPESRANSGVASTDDDQTIHCCSPW